MAGRAAESAIFEGEHAVTGIVEIVEAAEPARVRAVAAIAVQIEHRALAGLRRKPPGLEVLSVRGVEGDGAVINQADSVRGGQADIGCAAGIHQLVLDRVDIGANSRIAQHQRRHHGDQAAAHENPHCPAPEFLKLFILWTGSIPFAIVRRNAWSIATGISS